jgi:hypothetical protein
MADNIEEPGRNADGTPNEALRLVLAERYKKIESTPIEPMTEEQQAAMLNSPACWEIM